ncbi:MAG: alpha-1,2-fucosyltransferase, partial [Lachnospiraceae bacterium]|nr:alpha-1,2-fucosyltransferase [Lachnospiraceae bacterium]
MLAVRMAGGLGNQLFRYALYLYLKTKGKKVKLDTGFYRKQDLSLADEREYVLEKYFDIRADYLNVFERAGIRFLRKIRRYDRIKYTDRGIGFESEVTELDGKILEGYWETFFYAESCGRAFRETLATDTRYAGDALINEMKTCESVSIHVRRGDYVRLGRTVSDRYYHEALRYMREKLEEPVFYCFSDDPGYSRGLFGDKVRYVDNERGELFDLCAMSACRHNIIANSTFSAWAAWLNENEGKIIV